MLIEEFFDLVRDTPGVRRPLNEEQKAAIAAPNLPGTMIVAGPGSGKTTVLVLRAIRMILLDGMAPTDPDTGKSAYNSGIAIPDALGIGQALMWEW